METGFTAVALGTGGARLASGTTLTGGSARSGHTRLTADALGTGRAGQSRRGNPGKTGGRAVLLPQMEIVPAAVLDVPHPKVTGGGVVIRITGLGMAREAVDVIDKTENAADRRKTLDTHRYPVEITEKEMMPTQGRDYNPSSSRVQFSQGVSGSLLTGRSDGGETSVSRTGGS
jgi:hypothetical protein